jgi:ABC-type transport system involved in multi-copper enzyme maturation permease subunit
MSTSDGYQSPLEVAPSDVAADEPTLARIVGLAGLGATTLGIAAVIANEYGPRLVGTGGGYLIAIAGLLGLLYHALRDGDIEIRRVYGVVGGGLALIGLLALLVPGRATEATDSIVGYYFLPWGALALLVGLGFLVAFCRNETDPSASEWGEVALLASGAILALGSIALGVAWPAKFVGMGSVMALLALGYMGAYLSRTDVSVGRGFQVALGLGVLGTASILIGLGGSIAPTVIHDGPQALLKPNQDYDLWKVVGRGFMILLGLSGLLAFQKKEWLAVPRYGIAAVGLCMATIFAVGCFKTSIVVNPPPAFLIPTGLLLTVIGSLFLLAAISVVSDSQLVVLTRREFASFIYSPIGYIVLVGMALAAALGYWLLLSILMPGRMSVEPLQVPEPIVQHYAGAGLLGAIQAMFLVPALTMRAFSEEKRTGTMEVLLTAPVRESTIVLSKFFAAWTFFVMSWAPIGIYLIGLWNVGGQPFDYRPMLSYFAAVGVCGTAFIGMGLFFSSLTKNQIVAAVMTFAGMFGFFLPYLMGRISSTIIGPGLRTAITRFDFLTMWETALQGTIPVPSVVLFVSMAVLWMFITIKLLEIRKWG